MRNQRIAKFLLFVAASLMSAAAWAGVVGTITHLGGVLRVTHADGTTKLLSVKSEVLEGDTLKTEANTFTRIKFMDGGEVVLRPETVFKVTAYSYEPDAAAKDGVVLDLVKGGLRSVTGLMGKRNPDKFKLGTPTATIGVRGTNFGALFCQSDCLTVPTVSGQAPSNGLYVDVVSGAIVVTNGGGSQQYMSGQFGYVPGPQVAPVILPPSQGVQVTMPPSISSNTGNGSGVGSSKGNTCTVQ